ncbi:MAG TPA: TagF domain-containing protein [Polyangiaceae bacterium]|nr:TagF domain-containing protein [Polyangiaceae bacterium]
MSGWRSSAVVVGKASWYNEYLRPRDAPPAIHGFDEWLFRNAQTGSPEPTAAVSHGFLIRLEGTADPLEGIAGVLTPSADRAGRAYPLAVAASVALSADAFDRPEVVPILLEGYWEAALEALSRAQIDPSERDRRDLGGITSQPLGAFGEALDLYTSWTQQTSTSDVCGLLGRSIDWLEHTWAALRAIQADPRPQPPIRLPLGAGGGAALCLWLDLWRRTSRARGRFPSFFWSHDESLGEALLFPGPLGDAALAALWGAAPADGGVVDLRAEVPPGAAAAFVAADSGLDRAQLALSAFLERGEGHSVGW